MSNLLIIHFGNEFGLFIQDYGCSLCCFCGL